MAAASKTPPATSSLRARPRTAPVKNPLRRSRTPAEYRKPGSTAAASCLFQLPEHGRLFTPERRESLPLEKRCLAGDREQFADAALPRALDAAAYQPRC